MKMMSIPFGYLDIRYIMASHSVLKRGKLCQKLKLFIRKMELMISQTNNKSFKTNKINKDCHFYRNE